MNDQAESTSLPAPIGLERRDLYVALLLAGLLVVMAISRMYVGVCGQCHDDAIYVVSAKALAEGDGYRLTNLPGSPPQTKYPILYPAILAGIWKLWPDFPANLIALQGFSVACGAIFVALFYLYVVRFGHCSRTIALGAGLICCTSTVFVFFATVTLSEMLFGILVVVMLWWLESALRNPEGGGRLRDLAGGVLLALPFLCRSIGLLFVPLALALLFQSGRRYRWAAVGATLAIMPWLLWTMTAMRSWQQDPIEGYYTDYLGWWLSFGAPALARVVTHNFMWVLSGSSSAGFDGLNAPLHQDYLSGVWISVFTLLGAIQLLVLITDVRRGRTLATAIAAYLLVVCVWPWSPHRFLIPVLPFLMVYQLRGLAVVGRGLVAKTNAPRWAIAGLALLVLANTASWGESVYQRHTRNTPNPELRADAHAWSSNQQLFAWLRDHSNPGDLLAAGVDPMLALYTERLAYYPIVFSPAGEFYGLPTPTERIWADAIQGLERRKPRYLVITPNFHGSQAFLAWVEHVQKNYPERMKTAYSVAEDPRYIVYEMHYPLTQTEARK